MTTKKPGIYANIHAKQERVAHGSGEKMRKPGDEGAPTADNFEHAAGTEKPTRKKLASDKAAAKKASPQANGGKAPAKKSSPGAAAAKKSTGKAA